MTVPVALLGFAAVLAVAAIGVSLFAVWRSQVLAELADQRSHGRIKSLQSTVEELQRTVAAQAAHIEDLQSLPFPASASSATLRTGLNLTKRSQILRMHRSGDAPDHIASALELPQQEVDLLIKVHRIVLQSR
jgi:hypothetical protein